MKLIKKESVFKTIPHNVKVRLLANFLGSIAYRAVFPFIALYLNDLKGTVFTGVLISFTVVLGFIMRLVGGYLADLYSRKKIVLIGNSINCASMIIMTLAIMKIEMSASFFLVGYLIHTVFVPLSGPSMKALIIDSTPPELRKNIYTVTYWSMNVAASFGYFIGGMLYDSNKLMLFIMLSISSLMTVILYAVFLDDITVKKSENKKRNPFLNLISHYSVAIKDYPFLLTVIGFGFLIVGEEIMPGYVAIRLEQQFNMISFFNINVTGVKMLSLLMLENTIFVILLTIWMNKLTDKWNKIKVLSFGLIIYATGFVAISISLNFSMLLLFGLINSIGETIAIPLFGAEQIELMPEDKRASYIALSSLSTREAAFIAGILLSTSYFVSSLVMTAFVAFLLFFGVILILLGLYGNENDGEESVISSINQ